MKPREAKKPDLPFPYPLTAKVDVERRKVVVTNCDGKRLFSVQEESKNSLTFEFGEALVKIIPVAFNRFNVEVKP
jgi:hypothetical protein